jgi:hypothetical protein
MNNKVTKLITFFLCCILLVIALSGCIENEQKSEDKELSVSEVKLDKPSILPDWKDGQYHDYYETTDMLSDFNIKYPDLVNVFSIGKSVLGKEIWCIRITNEKNNQGKLSCLIDGCIHGCEWEAGEACLYLSEYLLINHNSNVTIGKILNTTEVYIVPLLNPDGREKDERWNENGIDLNRNFNVHFGRIRGGSIPLGKIFGFIKKSYIKRPDIIDIIGLDIFFKNKYWTNSGRYAFSEPETKALSDFMKSIRSSLSFYLNCHTAMHGISSIVEIDYKPEFTAKKNEVQVLKKTLDWFLENTEYGVSYPDQFSFTGAGFAHHWVFKEFRIPSFCFEILSTDYEPMWGGGRHDHLVHWMKTTLPVFMYLLVNIDNLSQWRTPDIQPQLPEGVPPETL